MRDGDIASEGEMRYKSRTLAENLEGNIQGDQKVSVHLMITVKNTQKYFKQFQSLTMIM
jgi:hypothetical protein